LVNLFANQLTRRIVAGAQKATDSRQAAAAAHQQQQQQQRQQQQRQRRKKRSSSSKWNIGRLASPSVQFWGSSEALRGRDGSVAAGKAGRTFQSLHADGKLNVTN